MWRGAGLATMRSPRFFKTFFRSAFSASILLILIAACSDQGQVFSQSFAYKTLLSTLYDTDFPVVHPDSIQDLNSYQLLDTREKVEFEVSHLQNAIWVGYDQLDLERIQALDKSKPVLVYCTVGARSQEIGKKLLALGFEDVQNLYGGIIHWVNEGKEVYAEDQKTKRVHTYSMPWGVWLTEGEKVYD